MLEKISRAVLILALASAATATTEKQSSLHAYNSKEPVFRRDYEYNRDMQSFLKVHKTVAWFGNARKTCFNEGSELMVTETRAEAEYLQALLAENDTFYMALHDNFEEGHFETLDERPASGIYVNWPEGSPILNRDWINCVVLDNKGFHNDVSCTTNSSFVCRKHISTLMRNEICDTYDIGYQYFQPTGRCFKLHETPETWRGAVALCRQEGSTLAMPDGVLEAQLLDSFLKAMPSISRLDCLGNYLQIGFHHLFLKGNYITMDGSPITQNLKWTPGFPFGPREDGYRCGGLGVAGTLVAVACANCARFVCQKNADPKLANIDMVALT